MKSSQTGVAPGPLRGRTYPARHHGAAQVAPGRDHAGHDAGQRPGPGSIPGRPRNHKVSAEKKGRSPLARGPPERNTQEKGYVVSATVSNALSGLVTVRQLAEHTGYSRSTVYKWSSGERPSPYPEPVRKNGRVIGWRREDVEAADKANKYSRADWLYGRKAA
ncbi:AlpA family phage regulatory protein [Bifidobacterium bifidum]|nr:AlpA family phage regulatory protein [Bifidobacterium bifidum]PVV33489.1 AlpA family phage regulatory protein [Bifidobacterium bifidum]PVV35551.1 AlpA family phage regulatory protein [Bifidobacterium bifidum]PVV38976.1 AlpA family phage regulatory protein [Bifidobacterium bifidum]PVV40100.1 AlpA family phage regulatory protein [Bifidobacterium bifidum]